MKVVQQRWNSSSASTTKTEITTNVRRQRINSLGIVVLQVVGVVTVTWVVCDMLPCFKFGLGSSL